MTSRLSVVTSTAAWLFFAVAGCSTGSSDPPQTGPASGGTEETTGSGSGTTPTSGSTAQSGASSGTTMPTSGTTPTSGTSSGTMATSGTTPTSGTSSGASGSTSGAASGSSSGATSGATSGTSSGATSGAAGPSFAALYASIGLGCTCLPCHATGGGGFVTGKLDLSTSDAAYKALVGVKAAGGKCGTSGLTRVVAGNAMQSLLYNKLNAKTTKTAAPCGDPMPDGNVAALSAGDITMIQAWINGGANP